MLAVDPSSPFSGGALLGDRVRMGEHATDDGVFIRSMATRGHLGGLAWATPQALRVLDAAGCDVVLIETVGVGQSEVEIVALADTTVVLLAPGSGDGVQAAKAGILEVADVFVVNKADRDGADQTVRDLRHVLSLGVDAQVTAAGPEVAGWRIPVLRTVAARGEGMDELVAAAGRAPALAGRRPASASVAGWRGPARRSRPSPWSGCGPVCRRSGVPVACPSWPSGSWPASWTRTARPTSSRTRSTPAELGPGLGPCSRSRVTVRTSMAG